MKLQKLRCFFNYHQWEMTEVLMPYVRICKCCQKRMIFMGYNTWIEEKK